MQSIHLLVFLCLSVTTWGQIICTIGTSQVMGCYTDFTNNEIRALPLGPYNINSNSFEACAAVCSRFGTTLAAVEFGTQCFCGNSINPEAKSVKVDNSQCNMVCPGNSSEMCGAADRMVVYQYNCAGNPLPNYQACVDPVAKALPYCDLSLSYEARLEDLLSRLTIADKVSMLSPQPALGDACGDHTAGKASIGLPAYYWLVETNTGVASACITPDKCATTFSGPLGMAASFNRTNWLLKGQVLGTEMRAFSNAQWHRGDPQSMIALTGFGPNINIARDPRFGRTSELPGEDPYLNGHYAKHMVTGMQTEDDGGHPLMLAYLKHYTAYSRETDRGHDSYNITMHDLFETYLAQYEIAFIEGKPTGAMCSYNAENGIPSCANNFLLNKVIREMWNRPDAHITTDCGAVSNMLGYPANAPDNQHAAAWTINNGTDIEMGSTVWTNYLVSAVTQGLVAESTVDNAFRRSYLPHFRAGRFDPVETVSWTQIGIEVINSTLHQSIQFEAALQSLVLLKNDNNVLPIKPGTSVAVLGPMGETRFGMLSDYAGDQICWNDYDCIPTIAEAIAAAHSGPSTDAPGVDINSSNSSGITPALALGAKAEVIILVLGIDRSIEHEGIDRTDTALPGLQEPFAQKVLALGKPTILVLCNGGALAIDNLISGPAAIIEAYNPSVAGPRAIAETIFGLHNRWGKLVTTMYPHDFINQNPMTNYNMALPPGRTYRYYTGKPLFTFGYGLSYTTFSLDCKNITGGAPFTYTCTVTNTGQRDGDEIVMVYHAAGDDIRKKVNHPVPIKALVEFERVHVPVGGQASIEFSLFDRALSLVNENGVRVLYPGQHSLIFSRGYGTDVVLTLTI